MSAVLAARLPKTASLTRTIQRARSVENLVFNNPTSLADLEIPEPFKLTQKGEMFLLHDSGGQDSERFLVYATQENLNLLAECKHWLADGTFKCVPSIFLQMYTIHAIINGKTIPLV